MALDLPRAIKRLGIGKRRIVFAAIQTRHAETDALLKLYVRPLRLWSREIADNVLPLYTASLRQAAQQAALRADAAIKDSPDDLAAQLDASAEQVRRLTFILTPELRSWIVKAESIHRSKFVAAAKTAAGVDLETILGPQGVETTLAAVLQENVALIRGLSDDARTRISEIIFRNFKARTPRRQVAKEINDALGIGRKRALRIASDQSTKLSARLDQERQQELGIDQFQWQHSGKVHYRPIHKARDGKIYSWNKNGLNGDLPGVAINCGCKAKAYIDLGE